MVSLVWADTKLRQKPFLARPKAELSTTATVRHGVAIPMHSSAKKRTVSALCSFHPPPRTQAQQIQQEVARMEQDLSSEARIRELGVAGRVSPGSATLASKELQQFAKKR